MDGDGRWMLEMDMRIAIIGVGDLGNGRLGSVGGGSMGVEFHLYLG